MKSWEEISEIPSFRVCSIIAKRQDRGEFRRMLKWLHTFTQQFSKSSNVRNWMVTFKPCCSDRYSLIFSRALPIIRYSYKCCNNNFRETRQFNNFYYPFESLRFVENYLSLKFKTRTGFFFKLRKSKKNTGQDRSIRELYFRVTKCAIKCENAETGPPRNDATGFEESLPQV